MDGRQCMIIDLDKCGDKRMFVTEQVSHISETQNGFYAVKFSNSNRVFKYSKARLLYLTHPEIIDLGEKGLFIRNRRINNIVELLRYTSNQYMVSLYDITPNRVAYQVLRRKKRVITVQSKLPANIMFNCNPTSLT